MNKRIRKKRENKKWSHMYSKCPICRRKTLVHSYGLAFGGIGSYQYCDSGGRCTYYSKRREPMD